MAAGSGDKAWPEYKRQKDRSSLVRVLSCGRKAAAQFYQDEGQRQQEEVQRRQRQETENCRSGMVRLEHCGIQGPESAGSCSYRRA